MRTNKEKYDHYRDIYLIQEAEYIQNFINETFGGELPDKIYSLSRFEINERVVDGVSLFRYATCDKLKPKKDEVKTMMEFAEDPRFEELDLRISYYYNSCGFKASGSDSYKDILEKKYLSFNKDELIPQLEENKRIYEVKEGQFACAYCSKATNNEDKVTDTLIFQSTNNFGRRYVAKEKKDYCSSRCASYNQMAHEG